MYSQEQIDKANDTSIMDYLHKSGYHPVKTGSNYELKGFEGLQIDPRRNRWNCRGNPDAAAKGGPIQLVVYLESVSWKEAVARLIKEEAVYKKKEIVELHTLKKEKFSLPERNTTYHHMFAYLIKTRKIDADIVKDLTEKKIIYENVKKSCVFLGKDNIGEVRYASIRSTNTMGQGFKGEAVGSDKRFGFCISNQGDTLTVFESPMDVLSYMTIFKRKGIEEAIMNESLLSLGGVEELALKQYLKDHSNIKKIQVALDMDEAGERGFANIVKNYSKEYQIKRLKLPCKDYNQYLVENYESLISKKPEQEKKQEKSKVHNPRDQPEYSKDYFECYALKKNGQGNYVVMKLKSNSSEIIPITWPIYNREQAEDILDKIIVEAKEQGIVAERLDSMLMMERFKEIVSNQLANALVVDEPELEWTP